MARLGEGQSHSSEQAPLVTIAMPIYNAGRYLRPAVISIMQQTLFDWELLVIDDGSTDAAVDGIRDLGDSRIRILRDGLNRGLAARLNEAIDQARGRFFARMDQDDISYPERLDRQLKMLEQDPELDLVVVRCMAIDADDKPVGTMPLALAHEELCARPWRGFYLPHPTWFGRIDWFRRHRYAAPGPYCSEDQELMLRSYRDSRFASAPEIMFAYRVRNRIHWKKQFRTRKTLTGLQLRHFFVTRQYSFGMLALATFVARIGMDASSALAQSFGWQGIHRYHAVVASPHELQRWREVLNQIAMAEKRFE